MEPGIDTTDNAGNAEALAPVKRRYRLLHAPTMPAPGTVLRRGVLQECDLLAQAAQAARLERALLLARTEEQAQARARSIEQQAQAATLSQAAQLLGQMEQARDEVLQQAEELLLQIVRACLHKLLVGVPASWQDRSSVRLLVREFRDATAQMQMQAQLHVRPEVMQDEGLLAPGESWPTLALVADETLAPGQCLLRCAQGELRADYHASVDALLAALHSPSIHPHETLCEAMHHEDTRLDRPSPEPLRADDAPDGGHGRDHGPAALRRPA